MQRRFKRSADDAQAGKPDVSVKDLPQEEKERRVREALADAKASRIIDEVLDDLKKEIEEAAQQHELLEACKNSLPHELRHSAFMSMVVKNPNGEPEIRNLVIARATEAVQVLMDQEPLLFTGLMWDGLDMPGRLQLLEKQNSDASIALGGSVLEALPGASLDYIQGWQRVINSGDAWDSSRTVGNQASFLIEEGYTLLGTKGYSGAYCDVPSRDDLPAGKPGTPGFVKAIMGEAYLVWLRQQER